MASVSDFRNGMAIRHHGDIWIVTEFQHVKPGKGQAFIRTKLKQLKTGKVVDNTFRLSDTIEEVRLEEKEMQFLYATGDELYLMDTGTYEQINVPKEMLGDQIHFLKEGNSVNVQFLEGRPVTASLPMFIELQVTEAPPGVKGDTVSNLQKQVTLETGAEVQAPLFIKEGDILKIDTRDGRYIERLSK
ncbi:elongation factor P [candidate division KSB1 bacterium]|nr:elongation factor P [candidate division KSB1 bacterium]NIR69236.1 elongation factor P [candidate division KSB1 bacterium]NIS27410.1 elongation factor P [candidate division KSB1 bacterium]NIT74235.1 elongation factor P [candidate division KSB1 bacterium]NIU28127.1 elongation factor P [candidate division KSB1 bacterium]